MKAKTHSKKRLMESTSMLASVPVLQEHIDRGEPGDPQECALALALQDAGFEDVSVSSTNISFTVSFKPNDEVREFIQKFDDRDERDEYDAPNRGDFASDEEWLTAATKWVEAGKEVKSALAPFIGGTLMLNVNGEKTATIIPSSPAPAKAIKAKAKKATKKAKKATSKKK